MTSRLDYSGPEPVCYWWVSCAVRVGGMLVYPGRADPPTPPFGAARRVAEVVAGSAAEADARLSARLRLHLDRELGPGRRVHVLCGPKRDVRSTRTGAFIARWEFALYVE